MTIQKGIFTEKVEFENPEKPKGKSFEIFIT